MNKIKPSESILINKRLVPQKEKNKPWEEVIGSRAEDITDLSKQQENIWHLASIVESSEDAIISKSMTGIIRSWNKGSEKMFGYTSNEAIGKHISLIIPPDFVDEENNILSRIGNNEIIEHYETIRNTKNGEHVYVSLTISPVKDSTGKIIGAAKIARNITHQKKHEDDLITANGALALQNEEKEMRAAELLIANKELAFQNAEKEKRAAELLVANNELAFQNGEREKRAAELLIANIELAFQNHEKEKRAEELLIVNKELALRYREKAKTTAVLITENEGLAIDNVNQLKEVSNYKHAMDESSIVAITDQKGIIIYVNNNFCKISKYSADELIGQDHRIINSGHHSKEFIRNLWVTIANGNIWRGELKNKAKDGTIYWVDTTIVPFLNDQGKPYQYTALRADITQRKLAEEEVRFLNEDLEKRVKERTEDLESFSYSVSHDLRAPLRAVNGYARMFKGKYGAQFDTEGNRLINNIVDNATKMGQLIDDLLTFSRLGRREMTRMNIPMHEIVTNLCTELKKEQGDRDIKFNIRSLLPAKADNIGIKQVWLNLISNAIKYSRLKEHAVIEIGSEIKGQEIIYYIKDNGAGFDMRYVGKLFNIFQRLHSEDEFEGTGIGLAIVQRIIHKHGGKVWAEGKVNEEAIFYFSLNKS